MEIPRRYISFYLAAVVIISMCFVKYGLDLTITGNTLKVATGGALVAAGLVRIFDSCVIGVRELYREITA